MERVRELRLPLLGALLALVAGCGRCEERIVALGLSSEGEAAIRRLIDAEALSVGYNQTDGLPKAEMVAARTLAGEERAADAFLLLVRCGSDAAALYGVSGLLEVAPGRLDPPPPGMERHGRVELRSVCLIWRRSYPELLAEVLAGDPAVRALAPEAADGGR